MERMHEVESAQQAMDEIIRNLHPYPFPFMRGHISTLGGGEVVGIDMNRNSSHKEMNDEMDIYDHRIFNNHDNHKCNGDYY